MVAPKRLRQFKCYDKFIEIPDLNCYLDVGNIREKIRYELEDDLVVCYCASMMTNVLIHDFKDENITQIDCGSVFEPYIGHANRTTHHYSS